MIFGTFIAKSVRPITQTRAIEKRRKPVSDTWRASRIPIAVPTISTGMHSNTRPATVGGQDSREHMQSHQDAVRQEEIADEIGAEDVLGEALVRHEQDDGRAAHGRAAAEEAGSDADGGHGLEPAGDGFAQTREDGHGGGGRENAYKYLEQRTVEDVQGVGAEGQADKGAGKDGPDQAGADVAAGFDGDHEWC